MTPAIVEVVGDVLIEMWTKMTGSECLDFPQKNV